MVSASLIPDNIGRAVMLVYGRMQDGKSPYWCYVAVKPSEYKRFQQTLQDGKLNLHRFEQDDYGEIVVSGPGLYPPADITREVARAYNTPLKELFGSTHPEAVMTQKIAQLKQKIEENSGAAN